MKLSKNILALAAIAVTTTAMPVEAAVFNFGLGGLSWKIDTETVPFSADVNGITYAGVDTGTTTGTTSADIDFFAAGNGGGLRLTDFESGDILGWFSGPALYSSTGGQISFNSGSFALSPLFPSSTATALSISAVPEPTSWTLMIAGFGMTGAAMRGYRRRLTVAAA